MNRFDQHISDKIRNVSVNPPPELHERIKQAYPKPTIKHYLKNHSWTIIAAAGIIAAVLLLSQIQNPENEKNIPTKQFIQEQKPIVSDQSESNDKSEYLPKQQGIATSEDIKSTGNSQVFYSYKSEISIPSNRSLLIQKEDEISVSRIKNAWTIHAENHGEYMLIVSDNNSQNFDTLTIHFIKHPEIFKIKDTTVCGKEFLTENIAEKVNWTHPKHLIISNTKNLIKIESENYGTHQLIGEIKDNIGSYSDTMNITFIPYPELKYQIQALQCYNDNSIIELEANIAKYCKIKLSNGKVIPLSEQKYELQFDYDYHSANLWISYNDGKCTLRDTVTIRLPQKPDIELITEASDCLNKGSIELQSSIEDFQTVFINNVPIKEKLISDLEAGIYELVFIDKNQCTYSETVEIEADKIIHADFDFQFSMDGISVKANNKTTGLENFSGFIQYNWYVNGELKSEEISPELDLTSISNTIKLEVIAGEECSDIYEINNVQLDKELIRCPNFFTPNGDGQYDIFKVLVDNRLTGFKAIIANRTGQLVHEWNDSEQGWDGRIMGKEQASEGVYFYIIQAYDSSGKPIEKRGTVQLIR
jgi:gliding motility-associated-like protein